MRITRRLFVLSLVASAAATAPQDAAATRNDAVGLVTGPCDLNEDEDGRMTRYLRTLM
jgi:hypothetical protein